jgi:hypothetical protein
MVGLPGKHLPVESFSLGQTSSLVMLERELKSVWGGDRRHGDGNVAATSNILHPGFNLQSGIGWRRRPRFQSLGMGGEKRHDFYGLGTGNAPMNDDA